MSASSLRRRCPCAARRRTISMGVVLWATGVLMHSTRSWRANLLGQISQRRSVDTTTNISPVNLCFHTAISHARLNYPGDDIQLWLPTSTLSGRKPSAAWEQAEDISTLLPSLKRKAGAVNESLRERLQSSSDKPAERLRQLPPTLLLAWRKVQICTVELATSCER